MHADADPQGQAGDQCQIANRQSVLLLPYTTPRAGAARRSSPPASPTLRVS